MGRKLLIIGIDGGSWSVLKPAMEEGYMPYLRSMVEQGTSGILESTIPPITPAAWSSFQTGMNPGKNGVFGFQVWDRQSKQSYLVNSRNLQRTLWEIASEAGRRVGVINVPMTYPPKSINGYIIGGLMTPSLKSDFTYPSEFKYELLNQIPDYHIFALGDFGGAEGNVKGFVKYLRRVIKNRAEAALYLLGKDNFDLFMCHFQASDVLQHILWGYLDKEHPFYALKIHQYILEHFYAYLDVKIKEIRQGFEKFSGSNFLTLIISDHGFQSHRKAFNLGNWLYEEGFTKLNAQPRNEPFIIHLLKKIDFLRLRNKIVSSSIRQRTLAMAKQITRKGDVFHWEGSRAFSYGDNEGFIYLLEENEADRIKTILELTQKLKKIIDPETNRPVVKEIYLKEDIWHGDKMNLMPDLFLEPDDRYSFKAKYLYHKGLFYDVIKEKDVQIGKHHKDGILVATGEGVKRACVTKADLVDLAPTILYYLDIGIPNEMDGKVIKEIFKDDFVKKNAMRYQAIKNTDIYEKEAPSDVYTEDDAQKIKQNLKDLGYL